MSTQQINSKTKKVIVGIIGIMFFMTSLASAELVGHWSFNSSDGIKNGKAVDISGNGNDGTIHGAVVVSGKGEQALQFDGIDDYVKVPDSTSLDITDAITIEVWVKIESPLKTWAAILEKSAYQNTYGIMIKQDLSQILVNLRGVSGIKKYINVSLQSNQWHHIAVTYDKDAGRKNFNVFLDGSIINTQTGTGTINKNDHSLYIGKDKGPYAFKGAIDEVRIYNEALDADTIKEHYLQAASRTELVKRLIRKEVKKTESKYIEEGKVIIGKIGDPIIFGETKPYQLSSRMKNYFPISAWIHLLGHGWTWRKEISWLPEGYTGCLSLSSSESKLPDLTYPLSLKGLKGKYKIYFMIRTVNNGGIHVKLSKDREFVLIERKVVGGKFANCEVFWKEADITGQDIILRHPDGLRSYIFGIKLVSEKSKTIVIKDLNNCKPRGAISDEDNWKKIAEFLQDIHEQGHNTVYVYKPLLIHEGDNKKVELEKLRWLLDEAQKYDLKVVMPAFWHIKNRKTKITKEEIYEKKDIVDNIKNHDALLGYYLVDEPLVSAGENLKLLNQIVKEIDPIHPGFSCFAGANILGGRKRGWKNIKILCDYMKPDIVIHDVYPFRSRYYNEFLTDRDSIDLFAQCIDDAFYQMGSQELPLWMVVQSWGSLARGMKKPTPAGIRAQVYISIAHGVKGISCYPYYYSNISEEFGDLDNIIPTTQEIKRLNNELRILAPTLLKLRRTKNVVSAPGYLDVQTHYEKDDPLKKYIIMVNKDLNDTKSGNIKIFTPGLNKKKIKNIYNVLTGKKLNYARVSYWISFPYKLTPGNGLVLKIELNED